MLNAGKERGYSNFNVGNPNLDANSGRVAVALSYFNGFDADFMNYYGGSLGVTPEALDVLVKESKNLQIYANEVLDLSNQIRSLKPKELKKPGVLEAMLEGYNPQHR